MCSSVAAKLWFLTDRRIREDYPQKEILRALKAKCCEEELDFRAVVMDEVVLTIEQGNLVLLELLDKVSCLFIVKLDSRLGVCLYVSLSFEFEHFDSRVGGEGFKSFLALHLDET
ncbi:Beta-citrylglutamate synthase B [Camelus dromedarius]|uniref:Beta-citrylglutamate synthase B n=1 Tax=Camelus dromedarius TaxID=9838 RepID=A0A5N4C5Z8_CAMDR|nr:Beta-citrylglutamate synthase B [Camelus dromedarius]